MHRQITLPCPRCMSHAMFAKFSSIIKAEKRFKLERLRCLDGNPLPAFEAKIVGGQRTNASKRFPNFTASKKILLT